MPLEAPVRKTFTSLLRDRVRGARERGGCSLRAIATSWSTTWKTREPPPENSGAV
jgi:hypothetical protein